MAVSPRTHLGKDGITTGASSDIEHATDLARSMVTKWGLSERLGPLSYSEEDGEVFLGRQVTQHKQVSDGTAHVIDEEIRRVIDVNYKRAMEILKTNLDKLHIMADALVKYETIDETQDPGHHAARRPSRRRWENRGAPPPKRRRVVRPGWVVHGTGTPHRPALRIVSPRGGSP